MSSNAKSPNHSEGLTALSTISGKNEYLTSTNGALNTTGGGGGGGGTQYTDQGAVVPHPTGNAIIYFDSSNTPASAGTNQPFPVTASQQGTWSVGTKTATVNVGQQTVNTTAVQITAASTVPTNGIIIGALSTNAASIFIGGSGVTTSNGAELQPGSSLPFTANLNALYIISASSTTDKIWWDVT
ncbi:hypothetical protein UFOVP253_48 [uncultured Caudovirales phage]|uniref:Uncharacterized protein n=1 Tax=uncultured Caudovirales phage TaxID=2100421 RepID=A0A6J5LHX1_9CAUD|nr:hypothetical protein UFOVP253_48 [uncultured Caudovirales phage]